MGKVKKYRQKANLAAKRNVESPEEKLTGTESDLPISMPSDDLFKNISFNFDSMQRTLPDDMRSVKSSKSLKAEASTGKLLTKKDKLILRREQLLKKLSFRRETLERRTKNKRKKTAIIGDTNPLRDALPSIEHLLLNKDKVNIPCKIVKPEKPKGIQRAKERKKDMVEGIKIYKQILNNKVFKQNPLAAISEHIKNVVEFENNKNKKL